MGRKDKISPELKIQAILEYMSGNGSQESIARKYGVCRTPFRITLGYCSAQLISDILTLTISDNLHPVANINSNTAFCISVSQAFRNNSLYCFILYSYENAQLGVIVCQKKRINSQLK